MGRREEAERLTKKYQGYIDHRNKVDEAQPNIDRLNEEKKRLEERIATIDLDLKGYNDLIEAKEPKEIKNLTDEDIQARIDKGERIIKSITEIEAKDSLLEQSKEKFEKLSIQQQELTEKIDDKRVIKADIVAKADLPVDSISFENDYLTINDFKFDETQVCESDAVLLLANILAKINPGPIQVIGDASILDTEKLEELNRIAEENNKVMFVDEVIRDATDMVVVGYDQISTGKIPKKNDKAKTKSSKAKVQTSEAKDKKKDDENNKTLPEKPLF